MPLPSDLVRADEGTIVFHDAEIKTLFEGRPHGLYICDLAVLIEDAEIQCVHIGGDKDTLGEVVGPAHYLGPAIAAYLASGISAHSIECEIERQHAEAVKNRRERRAA